MYNQIEANKRKTVLLIAIFCAFIIGIGVALNAYYDFGYVSVVFAVILSTTISLVSYYHADKLALSSSGAVLIKKEDNPYVYRIVENLCLLRGSVVSLAVRASLRSRLGSGTCTLGP